MKIYRLLFAFIDRMFGGVGLEPCSPQLPAIVKLAKTTAGFLRHSLLSKSVIGFFPALHLFTWFECLKW